MDPRDIITEIQQLGGEIEVRLARIFELSESLYSSVRHGHFRQQRERLEIDHRLVGDRLDRATRNNERPEMLRTLQATLDVIERQLEAHNEIVPVYTMFANGWKRFAGSINSGLRRTVSIGRVVQQVQQKHGVSDAAEAPARPPTTPQADQTSVNELIELYGEETVQAYAASD
jgi:hypothetical protein